jgi:hypothetical protein
VIACSGLLSKAVSLGLGAEGEQAADAVDLLCRMWTLLLQPFVKPEVCSSTHLRLSLQLLSTALWAHWEYSLSSFLANHKSYGMMLTVMQSIFSATQDTVASCICVATQMHI